MEESHIELKLKKDLQYKFYDFPALKSEIVKENNQINIKLFDSYLQILYLQLRFPKEKKYFIYLIKQSIKNQLRFHKRPADTCLWYNTI